jgi:serine/threonine protein phosphatase PrpC
MTIAVTDRAGMTHTGHQRRSNEDAYLLREPLFMVADGVGGARAGVVAARSRARTGGSGSAPTPSRRCPAWARP